MLVTYPTSANPALIAGTPLNVVDDGQGTDHLILQPFATGSPLPKVADGRWRFEHTGRGLLFPPGTTVFGRNLVLSSHLTAEHAGIYTYSVRTSAGVATVEFNVRVNGEPQYL